MRRWRPALRIARRSVRRNLARSVLVAVLVGLPVAGATMVDVVVRSLESPEREARQAMGPADAQASVTGVSRLPAVYRPGPWGGVNFDLPKAERDPADVDLEAMLPPGSRVVPVPVQRDVRVRAGERTRRTSLIVADVRDPLLADEARLDAGRLPSGEDEVLLSPGLAEQLGDLRPGAAITGGDGTQLTVSGLASDRFCFACDQVVALPGSRAARLTPESAPELAETDWVDYLIDLPDGVAAESLWPGLAERGVALTPRDAYLHPERYDAGGGSAP